jgi:hypothetical protein
MRISAEQALNGWLAQLYIGKRIAGPEWDPAPFTVTRVYWDRDCDYVSIWFWSDETRDNGTHRGYCVDMDAALPEVLIEEAVKAPSTS